MSAWASLARALKTAWLGLMGPDPHNPPPPTRSVWGCSCGDCAKNRKKPGNNEIDLRDAWGRHFAGEQWWRR